MRNKTLRQLTWTRDLATQFWADLAGSDYLEQIAFARFAAPYLLDLVEPYLDRKQPVLDYGGGDNLYLVRELLRRDFVVAAFEPNSEISARNSDLAGLSNFRGTLSEVPAESFATVFLSEVIEHLDYGELIHVMKTVSSALHPSGVLVVTTPDQEDLFAASRYCPQCRQLFHPWGHVQSFDSERLEALLMHYGFQCEQLRSVDFSSAREPALRAESMAREIRAVATRLHSAASVIEGGAPAVSAELRGAAAALEQIAGEPVESDASRKNIGVGGTLLAIARKSTKKE